MGEAWNSSWQPNLDTAVPSQALASRDGNIITESYVWNEISKHNVWKDIQKFR